jgi:aryl carrier-like protein
MARTRRGDGEAAVPRVAEGPQATLVRIWCEVLGIASVGPHDNFFELGGDSILGLQVVARAKEAGLHLKTSQIFERQTISALVGALVSESAGAESPGAPGEPTSPALPGFPLVHLDENRRSRLERRLAELDGGEES